MTTAVQTARKPACPPGRTRTRKAREGIRRDPRRGVRRSRRPRPRATSRTSSRRNARSSWPAGCCCWRRARKTAWLLGTACLGMAKILENMEIGHNVMHGQWDWMNDPDIHSSVWDWDTASTAESWKHSHNYIHHTFTNILGKDKDLGYEIMRIDPNQKWVRATSASRSTTSLLTLLFEWGVAVHDTGHRGHPYAARSRGRRCAKTCKGIGGKARAADHQGLPRLAARSARARSRWRSWPCAAGSTSRSSRGSASGCAGYRAGRASAPRPTFSTGCCPGSKAPTCAPWPPTPSPTSFATCGRTPSSSAATSPTRRTPSREDEVENETRGGWYVRQLLGAANIEGSPLFHVISGNLGYQVEHHLYPGHAQQPLRRDRAEGQRHLRALRTALQLRAGSASSGTRCTAPSSAWRSPAASRGRSPAPTAARRAGTARHDQRGEPVPRPGAGRTPGRRPRARVHRRRGRTAAASELTQDPTASAASPAWRSAFSALRDRTPAARRCAAGSRPPR